MDDIRFFQLELEVKRILNTLNAQEEQINQDVQSKEIPHLDPPQTSHLLSENDIPNGTDSPLLDSDGLMGLSPYSPTGSDE